MPKTQVKGLNIHYLIKGKGDPFLILHGWGSSSQKWEKVINLLSFKFQLIAIDLPGFGKSQELKESWDINNYNEFLKEFIKKIGLKDFYLLGHSFGGTLAFKYNSENKVKKLFLVAPSLVREKTFKKKLFSLNVPCPPFLKKIIYKGLKSDYPYYHGTMRETLKNIVSQDLSHLKPLSKTILIWGKKDRITPLFQADKIKKDVLEIIPGGHALEIEKPDLLVEKILENL